MLITLRNSGADGIQYKPVIENRLLLEIHEKMEAADAHSQLYNIFLKGTQIDSFIVSNNITPDLLHMEVKEEGWGKDKHNRYEIQLEIGKAHYRLYYGEGGKPDFFKKLFKYFYPEMAEKQIEELV